MHSMNMLAEEITKGTDDSKKCVGREGGKKRYNSYG